MTERTGLRKKRPSLCHAFCATPGNIEIGGEGRHMTIATDFAGGRFFRRHRYHEQGRFPHPRRMSDFWFALVPGTGLAGPSGVKAGPGGAEWGLAWRALEGDRAQGDIGRAQAGTLRCTPIFVIQILGRERFDPDRLSPSRSAHSLRLGIISRDHCRGRREAGGPPDKLWRESWAPIRAKIVRFC